MKTISTEKIITLHPEGKKGVNISKRKYEYIRNYILATLSVRKEISYDELALLASRELAAQFEGNVPWYMITVKLDLEARRLIERVPKSDPQLLRLRM